MYFTAAWFTRKSYYKLICTLIYEKDYSVINLNLWILLALFMSTKTFSVFKMYTYLLWIMDKVGTQEEDIRQYFYKWNITIENCIRNINTCKKNKFFIIQKSIVLLVMFKINNRVPLQADQDFFAVLPCLGTTIDISIGTTCKCFWTTWSLKSLLNFDLNSLLLPYWKLGQTDKPTNPHQTWES